MKTRFLIRAAMYSALVGLAGCASGPGGSIYVPVGGETSKASEAPEPPRTTGEEEQPRVWRKSEQPQASEPAEQSPKSSSPSYRESGESLSPAARSLIGEADALLRQGESAAAIAQLERAQRIAPRSAVVYFKLAEAYVASDQLGSAEQFTLKGLSLAGNNNGLQRAGWMLLADIRRARGDVAGADQAEARAVAL